MWRSDYIHVRVVMRDSWKCLGLSLGQHCIISTTAFSDQLKCRIIVLSLPSTGRFLLVVHEEDYHTILKNPILKRTVCQCISGVLCSQCNQRVSEASATSGVDLS